MTPDCRGHRFSGSPEIREWRVLTVAGLGTLVYFSAAAVLL